MSIAPVDTSASSASTSSSKQLTGNFDTFLTLLTTQLQNQDPLAPMDSNQFTQQLVQFSSVEQQIHTNKNLESLLSLTKARAASDAVNYLGKQVTLSGGKGALINGEAKWTYGLEEDAKSSTISILDRNGRAVRTLDGALKAGVNNVEWDGKDNIGNQMPDGEYHLRIQAVAENGDAVNYAVASKGIVGQVDFTASEPILMLGPMQIFLSEVAALQN